MHCGVTINEGGEGGKRMGPVASLNLIAKNDLIPDDYELWPVSRKRPISYNTESLNEP